MPKQKVTADQLVAELNATYESDPDYDQANRFEPAPFASTGRSIRGYNTRQGIWTDGHQRALDKVASTFELDVEGGA